MSEIYKKYLLHKDMNELRLQNDNSDLSISQIMQDTINIRVEKERIETEEKLENRTILNKLTQIQ